MATSDDFFITIPYGNIRRLAGFCGPISSRGWDVISSGVLLSTTPVGLKAQTGSNDIFAYGEWAAEVHSHGQALVIGSSFYDVIKALPLDDDDLIDIAAVDDELDIRTEDGRYHRTLFLLPSKNFLTPSEPDISNAVVVEPDTAEWLKKASSAASVDVGRGVLNAVHVHSGGLVATDGYKFIIIDFAWDKLTNALNIPIEFIKCIPDPASYGDGKITLATDENKIAMSFGQLTLVGSVIPGEYPNPDNIRGIIPTSDKYKFSIGVKDLRSALRAVQPMVSDLGGAVLHPDAKIRVTSRELGLAEDELLFVDDYSVPVPINLPVSFMREAISLLKDEGVLIFIFHDEKPAQFPVVLTAEHGKVIIGAMPLTISDLD